MANPFDVAVPNVLQALMAGEQGYKDISGMVKEQKTSAVREQAAQSIMQGGDPRSALAQLLSIGDDKGAATLANVIHNKQTADYQDKSLAETARYHSGSLAQQSAQTAATERYHNASLDEQRRQFNVTADGQKIPPGWTRTAEGQLTPLPGGPADPEYIRKVAESKEGSSDPIPVAPGVTMFDPKTQKVVFKNDASTMSDAAKEVTARQIINGDLSGLKNVGRGAQGNEVITAIRNKAAEILMSENGMSPAEAAAHLSTKLQAFNAAGIGQSAEARTAGTREANLNLILKATEAAIPAALEASDKVARTGWVPINQIIQKGEVIASNPELRRFGMANLQLAEHWARAMNPTGVMRETDRDMALKFLSTADSKDTYREVVDQLKTQITRERDAVRGTRGDAHAPAATPRTVPGAIPPPPAGFQLVK